MQNGTPIIRAGRGLRIVALGLLVLPGLAPATTLTGKILFKGNPPKPQVIPTEADPACAPANANRPLYVQELEVNPNGTLKDVFVFIREGAKPVPAENLPPVNFDQSGCHYVPHVLGIRVNQPLHIINSDATFHNVHAAAEKNSQFNVGMTVKGQSLDRTFSKPEQMVKMKCDVHSWMTAYIGVMDHPYFSVTGDDGSYTIKDLPPGDYVVEAWQEKLGSRTAKLKVAKGSKAQRLDFTFSGTPAG